MLSHLLDLLTETDRVLALSYDYRLTLPQIVRIFAPAVADCCLIVLREGVAESVVAAHPTSLNHVTEPRELAAQGFQSIVTAPVLARTSKLGTISLATREPRRFDPRHQKLVELLGLRVGAAVDSAIVYAREHQVADRLQRSLLPKELPLVPNARFEGAYRPAAGESDVGGDWYDAFPLADGRIAISVGDVAGHGLEAAIIMGDVRQALRSAAIGRDTPSQVLEHANSAVTLSDAIVMVTAVFGYYDPATGVLRYAVAGHPPPVFANQDGLCAFMPHGGLPLGASMKVNARDWTFTIPGDSCVVFYTDGMTEYERDIERGEHRLLSTVLELAAHGALSADGLQERIFASVPSTDDAALLTLVRESVSLGELSVEFSAIPLAASIIRPMVRQFARELGLSSVRIFDLTVAVGEAVANVIEHAYERDAPGMLRVSSAVQGGELVVDIEDDGRWRPLQTQNDRGRGITIMQALADGVQIDFTQSGTRVRLRLSVDKAGESDLSLPAV